VAHDRADGAGRADRTDRADRAVGDLDDRAARHAALGDPVRLAIVDDLRASDRTPSELAAHFGLASNLLAHHLASLERVGLIERVASSGDRRRRYVRLRPDRLDRLDGPDRATASASPATRVLFVCTENSARSQLAAVLWRARRGRHAVSAGTQPAARVHPGAVAAARRAGLDLGAEVPRLITPRDLRADLIVTVCDRANEELRTTGPARRWHWSVPDPATTGSRAAFDDTVAALDERIAMSTR
jgi:ArsR family transcriptional regulator, arsenate/arsenite/antimonite-responsive transcriptional repressor / arsenate reductase (thioredoxin)